MNKLYAHTVVGLGLLAFFVLGWFAGTVKALTMPLPFPAQPNYVSSKTLKNDLQLEQDALSEHLAAKYKRPVGEVSHIVETAYKEAIRHSISPLLVLAIIEKESSLRSTVSNSYGALGLMQVVPRFHQEKLRNPTNPKELLTPDGNIKVGTRIVAEYLQVQKGNLEKALVKYSGNAKEYYPKVMRFKSELQEVISDRNSTRYDT